MKALIFTMTCGEGHNMLAKSISQAFESKNIQTKIVQTFGYNEKRVAQENKKFLWAIKRVPHIYSFFWNKIRKKNYFTNKLPYYVKNCLAYFKQEIENYNPDIIVCTHSYASAVISYMKANKMIENRIVTSTILFDFCLAPYWEHSINIDYIFQPLENTTKDLLKKGFNSEQIKTFGLPVREDFYKPYNKKELQKDLNIEPKFTILIIAGGNGLGKTLTLLKSIINKKLNINIIVINGKNKKNLNKISTYINKNNINNVINLGFVDNVDKYMKVSDLIITRCGGNGISEILALQKPFIIREKMILNENINKKMFIKLGCALGMKKIKDAGNLIQYLMENPENYLKMIKNIEKIHKVNAAQNIVSFLIEKTKDEK